MNGKKSRGDFDFDDDSQELLLEEPLSLKVPRIADIDAGSSVPSASGEISLDALTQALDRIKSPETSSLQGQSMFQLPQLDASLCGLEFPASKISLEDASGETTA